MKLEMIYPMYCLCETCSGEGTVEEQQSWWGEDPNYRDVECSDCDGQGVKEYEPCEAGDEVYTDKGRFYGFFSVNEEGEEAIFSELQEAIDFDKI